MSQRCARQVNNHSCGVLTAVTSIYIILDVSPPLYLDDSWWKSMLSWIWDRELPAVFVVNLGVDISD